MSFKKHEHAGKKPWEVEPFNKLRAVQVYKDKGYLCEGCIGSRAKILYTTPDGQALDLCFGCSEDAFVAGAITNRFAIENWDSLNHHWLASSSSWPDLYKHVGRCIDCGKRGIKGEIEMANAGGAR
jgi:hypothetical protein